jgi:tRNA1Val (adenine37-N6)-methyltransferase
MAFRFRQFSVDDTQSTLRVGTDAMLLGSWAIPGNAAKILDIGTGCGVLSLMIAQKSEGMIEAIDIDQSSIIEARANFAHSPWPSRIAAIHISLQEFASHAQADYGFIITNPPYFTKSLKSPSARINQTRHDESLSLNELARIASLLLAHDGCFALILPAEAAARFQIACAYNGLFPSSMLFVYPKPSSPAKRVLMEFSKNKIENPLSAELTILDASGKYTQEYLTLTGCYHNF